MDGNFEEKLKKFKEKGEQLKQKDNDNDMSKTRKYTCPYCGSKIKISLYKLKKHKIYPLVQCKRFSIRYNGNVGCKRYSYISKTTDGRYYLKKSKKIN